MIDSKAYPHSADLESHKLRHYKTKKLQKQIVENYLLEYEHGNVDIKDLDPNLSIETLSKVLKDLLLTLDSI